MTCFFIGHDIDVLVNRSSVWYYLAFNFVVGLIVLCLSLPLFPPAWHYNCGWLHVFLFFRKYWFNPIYPYHNTKWKFFCPLSLIVSLLLSFNLWFTAVHNFRTFIFFMMCYLWCCFSLNFWQWCLEQIVPILLACGEARKTNSLEVSADLFVLIWC